jgi:hypothetical protein
VAGSQCWQAIPTKLSEAEFEHFVLPHLSRGRRRPAPTLALHKIFNYIGVTRMQDEAGDTPADRRWWDAGSSHERNSDFRPNKRRHVMKILA